MVALRRDNHQKKVPGKQQQQQKTIQQGGPHPPPPVTYLPSCSQAPNTWYCYPFGETYGQSYHGYREFGNDNDTPFHTPIFALLGGLVTDASYHPWGGQVGVQTTVAGINGGNPVIYYQQHLDLIDSSIVPGQEIVSGQSLGLTGGQIGYGYHPESPVYTSGPHTETGFGAPWINGAQGDTFGSPQNPNSAFLFNLARAGQLPSGTNNGTTWGGNPGGFNIDPCTWPIFSWFCPGSSINWQDIGIRIILVITGVILVFIGFNRLFNSGSFTLPSSQQNNSQDEDEEVPPKEANSDEDASNETSQPQAKTMKAPAKKMTRGKAKTRARRKTKPRAKKKAPEAQPKASTAEEGSTAEEAAMVA